MPQRFGLEYVAEDGKRHQPLMVHRALYGSVERFFGTLVEHYAGAFPGWLAPVQAMVMPITDRQLDEMRASPDLRLEDVLPRACTCPAGVRSLLG